MCGRAGGVVGGDEVDGAVEEGLPECSRLAALRMGGRALEEGGAVGDVFGGAVEVVGAGFDGDGKAFALGCGEIGRACAVERWTMWRRKGGLIGLAAEVEQHLDGVELGFVGAGGEVGGVLRQSAPVALRWATAASMEAV